MASFRKRGKKWYYKFADWIDGRTVHREVPGCQDKRETERMANDAEARAARRKSGEIDRRTEERQRQEQRSIDDQLREWHQSILDKGRTAKHAELFRDRATELVEMMGSKCLGHLDPGKIQSALADLFAAGLAPQTVNHFRDAIRAFARWAQAKGRLGHDPLAGVTPYNVEEDIRHRRRCLTDDEFARLVESAANGPTLFKMTGALRAIAYKTAAQTGFRADELRSLPREAFHLDESPPVIELEAPEAKNRKGVRQKIPAALAAELRPWVEACAPGESVLPLHHETAKAMAADLARVQGDTIEYKTKEGFADFHSLRMFYINKVRRTGADLMTLKSLARHAKVETTLKHYARGTEEEERTAVERLTIVMASCAGARANGSDFEPVGDDAVSGSATHLPLDQDGSCRSVTGSKGVEQTGEPGSPQTQLVACNGREAERGGFEPPKGCDTLNGLANPREGSPRATEGLAATGATATLPIPRSAVATYLPLEALPELRLVVESWHRLPATVRSRVLSLVRGSLPRVRHKRGKRRAG